MSLVVHKLVLSPDGAAANTQTPTHHVTLAAYTHARSNVGDAMVRSLEGPPSGSMNTQPPSIYTTSSSSSSKHSSTYNLPFVLQDHNYGAPPPPTPPQSPPPVPCSSGSTPCQLTPHHHTSPHHSPQAHQQPSLQPLPQQKHHHHPHPQQTIPATSPSRMGHVTSAGSPVPVSGLLTSHPLSTMPPHRQQFMPHPKTSMFPSPHIPPPPVELLQSPTSITAAPPSSNLGAETDDDSRLSDRSSSVGPSGEETETAPEGEGDEQPVDDSITRCVCDFAHDDGYMIQCDRCFVWQHVDCMEIDRDNIPDEYLCEACEPRVIDRFKARALQIRRRQEIKAHLARLSSSDSDDNMPMCNKSRASLSKVQERKVVKKKKVKQIKDMKNGRKGPLSLLKKNNAVSCNNNIVPGSEERDRRMLVKTRRRKSSSMSGGEGVSDDSCGGPVERLRAWVEGYEVAVTNHYSPELRARVQAARINGVSPDLRASTQGAVLGHRCKVVENPNPLLDVFDSKVLVAATRLTVNTAITEFQGKYLLASQWNAQQPVMGQQYLPYVLQYHMPKEGLTVCVDARTYGNDARFARRSCKPNAEIRHVVERGSLHLYLVATRDIEEGEEVTLALETANSTLDLVCCLPEEHECNACHTHKVEATSPVHTPPHKKNGLLSTKKTFKKQQIQLQLRTSKRTTSTESRSSDNLTTTTTTTCQNTTPVTPVKQRRVSGCGRSPAKSPSVSVSNSPEELGKDSLLTTPPAVTTTPEPPKVLDKQQQQKMTREERKIAAYMKAFERMEKAAQRRQEMEKKKEEDRGKEHKDKDKKHSEGDEEDWDKTSSADESIRNTSMAEKSRRKGKKGRGKGSPQKRNHRLDTTASDLTGDESSCASVGLMSPVGPSVEGVALNFSSPPSGNTNAMGFRFPKTKKALMNEWLNETVDPVLPVGSPSGVPEVHSAGVPTCYMRSPATPLRRSTSVNQVVPGTLLNLDLPGGSAKKRWLRQAISEETESPQFNGMCPSPNSRPDSPTGGDYITPLKKRRLARESMSSEQSSTPPTTPVHSTSMEEDKMIEEMEAELAAGGVTKIKLEEDNIPEDLASRGDMGGDIDTKDSICAVKKEESNGEEELVIEEEDKISGLKVGGISPAISPSTVYKFEKEDRIEPIKEELNLSATNNNMAKTEIPLCLSSPKTYRECDEREEDGEDEEEDSLIGKGEEGEVKRKKKQVITRRKKRQQPANRRERKLPLSSKKDRIQAKDIKQDRCEETVSVQEEKVTDLKRESDQEEKVNVNECSTGTECADERTPKVNVKTEETPIGSVKLEENPLVEKKCEKEGSDTVGSKSQKVLENAEAHSVDVNVDKTKIKQEECSEKSLQVPVELDHKSGVPEIVSVCEKVVKVENDVKTDNAREQEESDQRTEFSDNKELNPNWCSKAGKIQDSKNAAKQPVSAKTEIPCEPDSKEENTKDQKLKGEGSEDEVVKEEKSVCREEEEAGEQKEDVKEHMPCLVVKEGSTKTNAKAEQVLSSDKCIKEEENPDGSKSDSSINVEDGDNIPQTCSHAVADIPKVPSPPEIKPLQRRSPSPVSSPHSPVPLTRRERTPSESDNLLSPSRSRSDNLQILSKEPKGPRTPEGPAPTSPEESLAMPESPRTPEYTGSYSPRRELAETSQTPEKERTPERTSRARVRGPCTPPSTPPTQQEDVLGAESERERDQQEDSDSSSKTKAAPVKRKLSILEYRKRKSVSSETDTRGLNGPRDQTPPPPPSVSGASLAETSSITSHPVTSVSSNTMQESLGSPSTSSPSKANYTSAVDSSPDLSLSPIRPLSLSLPAVLDDKITKDEGKREVECATQRGDATAEGSKDGNAASSVPGLTVNTTPNPSGTPSQDVKWNAAPTLLERQRENLTARLRREFGLCISDDDEDKSGLRLGCVSVVGRPSPPLLPPPGSLISSSPLSSRSRKPSGHQAGPDGEERDRSHRRHKEKNLPPPPPPPTAPPKNSIFQGREVTVQKVTCTTKGIVAAGSTQGLNSTNTSSPSSSTGPLAANSGNSSRISTIPTHPPGPPPFPGSGVLTQIPVPPPAVGPIPSSPSGSPLSAVPAVPPPPASQVGLVSSPVPPLPTLPLPLTNTGVSCVDASSRTSPSAQPTSHGGTPLPHLNSIPTPGQTGSHPPSQNSGYRARSYSRGQYSSSASGAMPAYPPGRPAPSQQNPLVSPPQGPHGLPSSARPQGPPPPAGPAGLVSPGLSYNGSNYNGLDCSAPGSRGS